MSRATDGIAGQLAATRAVLERHLGETLEAIHLFGSALDGGLQTFSPGGIPRGASCSSASGCATTCGPAPSSPATLDHDLAILLSKVRRHSLALMGPPAAELFEPVPPADFAQALLDRHVRAEIERVGSTD